MKKLVAAVLILPIPLLVLYQALISNEIEFLPPSLDSLLARTSASWIVHPELEVSGFYTSEYRSPDVRFSRSFAIEALPERFPVHVTALGEATVRVNGQRVTASIDRLHATGDGAEEISWKRGRNYELAPQLHKGENRLSIRVSNATGPPALRVEPGALASAELATSNQWSASQGGRPGDRRAAALAQREESFLSDEVSALRSASQSRLHPLLVTALLAFVAYSLLPLRFKPWLRESDPPAAASSPRRWDAVALALFLLVALCQVSNALRIGPSDGMADGAAHLLYVSEVMESWSAPRPEDGWQMYHPPLFYFVAGAWNHLLGRVPLELSNAGATRLLNTLFGLLNVVFAWLLLWRLFPDRAAARTLGFSVAACLPLGFYLNPNLTNEVQSGALIGLLLYASTLALFQCRPKSNGAVAGGNPLVSASLEWKRAIPLGVLGGLCLLSKYTGLFACASVTALLLLRWLSSAHPDTRRRTLTFAATFVSLVIVVSGWWYLRNLLSYGDPFLGNWDLASGFAYEQEPGYRTARFYTQFGAFLWHAPERAVWSGFWEGLYASLWTDAHRYLFDPGTTRAATLERVLLWLALLPSAAIALGFLRACRQLWLRQWDHPYFILVTTSFWTLMSVLSFTLEAPFYSTVSAVFLCSLIPAIGVFAALGLQLQSRQLGRLRVLLYTDLLALYLLTFYLFSL